MDSSIEDKKKLASKYKKKITIAIAIFMLIVVSSLIYGFIFFQASFFGFGSIFSDIPLEADAIFTEIVSLFITLIIASFLAFISFIFAVIYFFKLFNLQKNIPKPKQLNHNVDQYAANEKVKKGLIFYNKIIRISFTVFLISSVLYLSKFLSSDGLVIDYKYIKPFLQGSIYVLVIFKVNLYFLKKKRKRINL